MPISYRSILSVQPTPTLIEDVGKVVGQWLESKGLSSPTQFGTTYSDNQEVAHIGWSNEAVSSRRWQLREHWDEPSWFTGDRDPGRIAVTSITVVRGDNHARLWVDIDSPILSYTNRYGEEVSEAQESGTPRVVKALIADFETNDGAAQPFTAPLEIRTPRHLQELVTVLVDEQRIGSCLVSSPPPGVEVDHWVKVIADMTRGIEGMATSYVLDSKLLEQFNVLVGVSLALHPGSLRTIRPGAKVQDATDSFRHRILSARKIRETPLKRIARMLRTSEVRRLAELRLPQILREVDYSLLRSQRHQPLQHIEELQNESARVAAAGDLTQALAINERLSAELFRQKEEALDAIEQAIDLLSVVDDLKETIELLELENADVVTRADESQDLVDALRLRLIRANSVSEAYQPLNEEEKTVYPESFDELIDRMSEFNHLSFVGDAAAARALDDHPSMMIAVHKAWNALASLQDYASLSTGGAWSGGGIYRYINDGGHNGRCRLLGYRPTESETVQNSPKMISQRTVSVPYSVDPSGTLMMTAHIALLNKRAGAPRLYLHDNVAADGKVYIGYLGSHLTTAKY